MHRFFSIWTPMLLGSVLLAVPTAIAAPEDSPVLAALGRVGVEAGDLGRTWAPGALHTPAALADDPWSTSDRVEALAAALRPADLVGTLEAAWAEIEIVPSAAPRAATRPSLASQLSARRDRAVARRLDPVVAGYTAEAVALALEAAAARSNEARAGEITPGLLAALAGVSLGAAALADRAPTELASPQLAWPERAVVLQTPVGRVWIGSRGADVFEAPFVIVLDPGGDDLYLGDRASPPLSLLVDLGGHDTYRDLPIGHEGVAVQVDLSGDDSHHGDGRSQGATFGGCGVLLDLEGDDRYHGGSWSQGAATDGIGLLIDVAGDDLYAVSGPGQGVAEGRALGALLDRSGADTYLANTTDGAGAMAQGAATGHGPGQAGGIGLLVDDTGDDHYQATSSAQGFARWHGLGVALDRSGDDHWSADHLAQGCGLDEGVGVLLERSGDDRYTLTDRGQGHAHDRAVGWFFDTAGDDLYQGGSRVQGSATAGALAITADLGGHDRWYFQVPADGAGGGRLRGEEAIALRLDVGGEDVYGGGRTVVRGFGAPRGRHELDLDLPTPPSRTLGDAATRPALLTATSADQGQLLDLAGGPRSEPVETAVARLAASGPSLYTTLQSILDAGNPRTVLAVERVLLAIAAADPAWADTLQAALQADLDQGVSAPESAHLLSWWSRIGEAPRDPALPRRYLEDPDARARRAAAAVLEPLCVAEEQAGALVETLQKDDDVLARAAAARSLAGCGDRADVPALAATLLVAPLPVRDAASCALVQLARDGRRDDVLNEVRGAARDGNLQALEVVARIPDPGNLPSLRTLLAHGDPAVRGHAALAVGAIGSTTAIKALMGREAIEGDPYVLWCLDRALRTPGNPPAIAPDPR